ncbi:ATP-binding protein, partial [Micromonospora sp. b486]|uniref:ATP-binding protein n=1 Tax=Micromonospora sp. b486 TaxID=3053986 RepID=UPI0033903F0B
LAVITELMHNVIRHTDDGGKLELTRQADAILVEVFDKLHPATPTSRAGPASDRRRGLLIVEAMAREWGAHTIDDGRPGKVVWAEIPLDRPPDLLGRAGVLRAPMTESAHLTLGTLPEQERRSSGPEVAVQPFTPWTWRESFLDAARGTEDPDAGRSAGSPHADMVGYWVEATDGQIGSVDRASYDVGDALLVVDTGPWIFGRKVLLPAGTVAYADHDARTLFVDRPRSRSRTPLGTTRRTSTPQGSVSVSGTTTPARTPLHWTMASTIDPDHHGGVRTANR